MSGQSTQKTKLEYTDDGGTTWTEVTCITSVGGPRPNNPELDATCLSSDAMEYIAGLSDNGTIPFSVNWDGADSSHQALIGFAADPSAQDLEFKITALNKGDTNLTEVTFDGFVQEFGLDEFQVNQVQTASGSIRVSGAPTYDHAVVPA